MVEVGRMSQEECKLVEDLTEKIEHEIETFYDFPQEIKIINAKLVLGPNGEGGYMYYVTIDYEMDGIQHKMMRPVYANAKSLVIDMIFDIVDHYRRTHL